VLQSSVSEATLKGAYQWALDEVARQAPCQSHGLSQA